MKTSIFSALFATAISSVALAQDVTTVNATSSEISDNLDLRAVASIFGEAANLEDFERKLNDPEIQISNLDLNNDNRVDYIRVIETVDRNTHLIVLQSVLGQDMFQDVATIEVERDSRNNVQIQVVGDVYMYGPNYIYEPVYVHRPVIYTTFWVGHYRPYCSSWYWGYYPTYFYAWDPYPVFRYRRNVHVHINVQNHYNYVNVRRSDRAVAMYSTRRSDAYARAYPNRSFQQRNANVANRYELDKTRNTRDVGTRNQLTANTPRNTGTRNNTPRTENSTSIRNNGAIRNEASMPRGNSGVRSTDNSNVKNQTSMPRTGNVRSNDNVKTENSMPRNNGNVRSNDNANVKAQVATPRENTPIRVQSTPRQNTMPRAESSPRQNRTEQMPRANRVENAAPKGNSGREAQMQNRQGSGERRGGESRR